MCALEQNFNPSKKYVDRKNRLGNPFFPSTHFPPSPPPNLADVFLNFRVENKAAMKEEVLAMNGTVSRDSDGTTSGMVRSLLSKSRTYF